jgi:hypothetical protein
MSYNLRSTSYFGNHLDRELSKRGARTSGSTERKQARLQRFMDIEDTLQWVIKNEQNNVRDREVTRATELIYVAVRQLLNEKGLEGCIPDVSEILAKCHPDVIERIRQSVAGKPAAHGYNLRSTQ